MRSNPKPSHCAFGLNADRSIIFADTRDPVVVDLLEVQRRMPAVRAPKAIILQPLKLRWKLRVKAPEPARCARSHSGNGRVLPSRFSRCNQQPSTNSYETY